MQRRIALGVGLGFIFLRVLTQDRVVEEWREVADFIKSQPGERIVLFSGLIESEANTVNPPLEQDEYLRAPLLAYGAREQIDVIGLAQTDSQLREGLRAPFLLVAAHAVRDGQRSPERLVEIAQSNGANTELVWKSRLISVFRGR
jgi:hypothetical protein